jgi:hypothetical protein
MHRGLEMIKAGFDLPSMAVEFGDLVVGPDRIIGQRGGDVDNLGAKPPARAGEANEVNSKGSGEFKGVGGL